MIHRLIYDTRDTISINADRNRISADRLVLIAIDRRPGRISAEWFWRLRFAKDLRVASLSPSLSRHRLDDRLTDALAPSAYRESGLEALITG